MKRKFLPLFLTCALVLSSSMAFAADVNETVEGDALTAVSETQEEAAVEEETQEEVVTGEAEEASTPDVLADEGQTPAPIVVTDFGKAYEALEGVGAPVSGAKTVEAVANGSAVVLDVRSSVNYKKAHLNGSTNVPVFNDDGSVISTSDDVTAKAFTKYVTDNKANLAGKDIYIICNSGARGAQAATVLLERAGYSVDKLHTVTDGAKGLELRYAMLGTNGNAVTGSQAVEAVGKKGIAILDVRSALSYGEGHLKGAISAPLFDNNNNVVSRNDDELAVAFKAMVQNNADLSGKQIYVLCRGGQRGARAATALLAEVGYDVNNIHTITGGASDTTVKANLTYVSDTRVMEAINNKEENVLILDVRNADLYAKGHLKGSLSLPVFDKDNKLPDDLAKAFSDYVAAHKSDFDGKTIYILCNSGARGAEKATELLSAAGLKEATLRTIEGGAKSELLQANFVTDTKPATTEPAKKPANSKSPKTGDAAPIVPLTVSMFAALCAIVAVGKKKIVK